MTKISAKIIAHDSADYYAAVALRWEILRKPLGLSFTPKDLEEEQNQLHFGLFEGAELVACATLVPEDSRCKMRQLAVKADRQGLGLGTRLLLFLEKEAKNRGFSSIYCHARDSAALFYTKNSYTIEGDYFIEVGLPHLKMSKIL